MKKGILILSMICWIGATAQETGNTIEAIEAIRLLGDEAIEAIDSLDVPLIIDEMAHAVVHQDSLVTQLMRDKRIGYTRGEQQIDGFRVQIYASNVQQKAKQEAFELHQRVETLIDVPVYTQSEPPFWKVRIGNFLTREEANNYKNTLLELLPELTGSTYIVPDKIIIIR